METRAETEKRACAHSLPETDASGCGHRHFDKATALLSDEHRVIERVLAALEKLTDKPAREALESWKLALGFFRHFADQCHHFKEEKVLFPALEEHGIPRDRGPIGLMLMEHEEGRAHVRAMFGALAATDAKDQSAETTLFENARQYLRLLREPIQKEDEILFRMADEVIPADEQRKLLKNFEAHEAEEIGAGVHEKYLRMADELARPGYDTD